MANYLVAIARPDDGAVQSFSIVEAASTADAIAAVNGEDLEALVAAIRMPTMDWRVTFRRDGTPTIRRA